MFASSAYRGSSGAPTRSSRPKSTGPRTFRGRTRPNLPLSSKYKTEMCHYLAEQGRCPFGDQCTYAHAMSELRYIERHPKHKTLPCRDFSTVGFCPFGERCSFIHFKRNPDDILRSNVLAVDKQPEKQQPPQCSTAPSLAWGAPSLSSVSITISSTSTAAVPPPPPSASPCSLSSAPSCSSPSPIPEPISPLLVNRLPSPWNEVGAVQYCGRVLPLGGTVALVQDLLTVAQPVLTAPAGGAGLSPMSCSAYSSSSSGYSGTHSLSPICSPSRLSLSRASSTSDLSDLSTTTWPAVQLEFAADGAAAPPAPAIPSVNSNAGLGGFSQSLWGIENSGERLPIFKDISSKQPEPEGGML